ncbi:hypothetical protein MARINON1_51503 [Marinobacter salarius]|nr:hypothetical protein MBHK15_130108 [Marinobacter salarius]VXB87522.1 hypothetical protein MARINON1_51503 [Marinobacter salarius]
MPPGFCVAGPVGDEIMEFSRLQRLA